MQTEILKVSDTVPCLHDGRSERGAEVAKQTFKGGATIVITLKNKGNIAYKLHFIPCNIRTSIII